MKSIDEKKRLCTWKLYDFLHYNAVKEGSGVFLFDEERVITWEYALKVVDTLGCTLRDAGVRKGALVAVQAVRSMELGLLLPALLVAGAIAVMAEAGRSPREVIAGCGADIRPDWFLWKGEDAWYLEDAAGEKRIGIPVYRTDPGNHLRALSLVAETDVRDPSLIIFTSGSTGKSKAVVLCQQNYIANSVDGGDLFGENPKDRGIVVLPLHHIFGLAQIVCALVSRHSLFFPAGTSAEYILKKMRSCKITIIYGVPTYLLGLCRKMEEDGVYPEQMHFCLTAGGPAAGGQMNYMEKMFGCPMVPVYGMSEFVGITTLPGGAPAEKRNAGVGKFYPLNEGRILDESGNPVPPGEEGEVCVRGYDLMLGYYHDEEATKQAIDGNGFLHTGDLGCLDADGILHLTGRKKDLIIRGGENLSARRIEEAILNVHGIGQAAVVGIQDDYYGEVPCAMVTVNEGSRWTERGILEKLSQLLSFRELPVSLRIVPELPLTSTGKINKTAIREMFKGEEACLACAH